MSKSDNIMVLCWMEQHLDHLYKTLEHLQAHALQDPEPAKLVMKLIQQFQEDLGKTYKLFGLRPISETLCDGPDDDDFRKTRDLLAEEDLPRTKAEEAVWQK